MAKKEITSIAEKLRQLYELQSVDSKLDEITVLKGELPMEVQDLEDEIAGLQTRVNKLKDSINDTQSEISKMNANIIEARELVTKYDKQINDVKNKREFDALEKELELQKLDIRLFEKKIGELENGMEVKHSSLSIAEERLATKKEELEMKQVELQKIQEKTEKDEEKLQRKSSRARKKIEERLLKSYDKIRGNYRNGLAVVRVERDSCGGCFNQIPAQQQLEIQQRKKIMACEHCGRVLVDDEIVEVGRELEEEKS